MKRIGIIIFILLVTWAIVSCDIVQNHMETEYLCAADVNGSLYIKSMASNIYNIDLENKSFSLTQGADFDDGLFESKNALKYEKFAGEYDAISKIPSEYEGVCKHIEMCELDNSTSVVDACGYAENGILTGFVQVYRDTSGVYGNYAIEKISHSIIFSYNADTDEFSVIKKFDDVVIVAFEDNTVIYWKDKAYYSYDLVTNTGKYLVKDKAYDSGLFQLSRSAVLANEDMCILHLTKGKMKEDVEYMYVFDFKTDEFFELEYLNNSER